MIKILVILVTIIMVFSGLLLMSNSNVNHNNINAMNLSDGSITFVLSGAYPSYSYSISLYNGTYYNQSIKSAGNSAVNLVFNNLNFSSNTKASNYSIYYLNTNNYKPVSPIAYINMTQSSYVESIIYSAYNKYHLTFIETGLLNNNLYWSAFVNTSLYNGSINKIYASSLNIMNYNGTWSSSTTITINNLGNFSYSYKMASYLQPNYELFYNNGTKITNQIILKGNTTVKVAFLSDNNYASLSGLTYPIYVPYGSSSILNLSYNVTFNNVELNQLSKFNIGSFGLSLYPFGDYLINIQKYSGAVFNTLILNGTYLIQTQNVSFTFENTNIHGYTSKSNSVTTFYSQVTGVNGKFNYVYIPSTYNVNFVALNLPSGFTAQVNYNGNWVTSSNLINGSYTLEYRIFNSNNLLYYYGNVTFNVDGNSITVNLPFYIVVFDISNYKSSFDFSINIGSHSDDITASPNSIANYYLPNNTYSVSLSSIPSGIIYTMSKLSVSPTSNEIYINFTSQKFNLTINEIGLPIETYWTAEFNNSYLSSTSSSISYNEMDYGTYTLNISTVNGYVPSNTNVSINLNANMIYNVKFVVGYYLTFYPNINSFYTVEIANNSNFNNQILLYGNNSNPVKVELQQGTYYYKGISKGYNIISNSIAISGNSIVNLNFIILKTRLFYLTVNFQVSNVNKNISGNVYLYYSNGTLYNEYGLLNQYSISIQLFNNTYYIYVYTNAFYFNNNTPYKVTINGLNESVNISLIRYITYNIYESGLPAQQYWFINVNGSVYSSYSNLIQFRLPDNFNQLPVQIGNVSSFYTTSKITNLTPLTTNYYISFNVISNSPYTVTQFFLKYELYIGILILSSSIVLIAIGLKRRI